MTGKLDIETATKANLNDVTDLALKLWPDNSWDALRADFEQLMESDNNIVYLAKMNGEYVGFIHMSIRTDYVEGSSSSPVGYIEGIYVEVNYRHQGISRRLVQAGEAWSKALGCQEIASDTGLDNLESQQVHKKLGFQEAGRIVAYIKKID